jgi:hypothetical protein
LRGIPADDVDLDQLRPWLLHFEARSHGTTTARALEWAILGRDRQLWVCGDWQAVVLTSVHPDAVRIDFCAGRRREDWQQSVDEVIGAWARSLGKTYVISLARPGWAKYARERGYREIHREFAKRID